mgnify:CR=1 FL=1
MDKINLKAVLLQNMGEDSADFLPIMGDEKELLNDNMQIPDTLPILPLRNTVLFPGVIIPINIGRDKSLKLIKDSYRQSALIGVVAQKDTNTENPDINDLYQIGTVASILKILEMPDGTTTAIIQGKRRFLLEDILYDDPYHVGKISLKKEEGVPENDPEYNAIAESLKDMASKIVKYSSHIPNEAGFAQKNIESMLFLINFISSNTDVDYQNKQELLEIDNLKQRAIKLLEILSKQVSLLELKNDIQKKVKMDIDKQQREYFLHQQMKTIQDELGGNPTDEEIKELEELAETMERECPGNFQQRAEQAETVESFFPRLLGTIQLFEGNAGPALESPLGGQPGSGTCTPGTGCRSFRTGESKRKNFRILSGFKVKSRYEIADSVPLRPSGSR